MTEAERHEFQLRRLAIVLVEFEPHGKIAAQALIDAANFIQRNFPPTPDQDQPT